MTTLSREQRLARNLWLLTGFRVLQMTLFPVAIVTLFMTRDLGLSMTDVFVLQAWFGLCMAVLEFPGGFVADRVGYRTSLIIASGCSVTGWALYSLATGFYSVLVAEVALACSLALTSGTDAALMYESLNELRHEADFTRWFGRSRSLGAISEGSAALGAGVLYATWPRSPFVVQIVIWIFAAVLVLLLVEPHRAQAQDRHPWRRTKAVIHYVAVVQPRLRASVACYVVLGLATFIPVWIIAPYAEQAGTPVAWIGVIWAVANYAVALGNAVASRVEQRLGTLATLLAALTLISLGYAGLGAVHALFGFAFYYAVCLGRGLNGPVLNHLQQRLIPSSDRAALLSLNSLLFRGGFALLGPAVGFGADAFGFHRVLLVTLSIMAPAALAALLWLTRSHTAPVPAMLARLGGSSSVREG